jgi:hypothetical protein
MKIETANQMRHMALGLLIEAFFGAVWFSIALSWEGMFSSGYPAAVAVRVCWLLPVCCLLPAAFWLFKQSGRFPRAQTLPAWRKKLFLIIFTTYSLFGVSAFVLQRLHLEAYIISVLAIFVGAHFLPEGRLFGNRPMMASGVVMIFWAVAVMVSLPIAHLASVTAVGCGLILWQSAAITLAVALQAAHESGDLLTPLTQPTPLSE